MKNDFVNVSMKIRNQFVTGSQARLIVKNSKTTSFLIDNGVFQDSSNGDQFKSENYSGIEAVFLTHAHIDHSGGLVELMKQVEVPVFATPATKQLVIPMLRDMYNVIKIHDRKNYHIDEKNFGKLKKMLKEVSLYEKISCGNCDVTFLDNSHILGASMIMVKAHDLYRDVSILFSGDFRIDHPFLRTNGISSYLKKNVVDVLVLESTYGNKPEHISYDDSLNMLEEILSEGLAKGDVLLGTFSIDRTPVILNMISQIQQSNELVANSDVILDGALATEGLAIYKQYESKFKYSWTNIIPKNLIIVGNKHERSILQNSSGHKIIVSTSGQFHGGSIVSWVVRMLGNENATIVSTGYIAHQTGKRIFEAQKGEQIDYCGQTIQVNADRKVLKGISAHADRKDLAMLVSKCLKYNPNLKVILTHGDLEAKQMLKQYVALNVLPVDNIYIQGSNQHFEINKHSISSGNILVDD